MPHQFDAPLAGGCISEARAISQNSRLRRAVSVDLLIAQIEPSLAALLTPK